MFCIETFLDIELLFQEDFVKKTTKQTTNSMTKRLIKIILITF
jgi:hypothetical protein